MQTPHGACPSLLHGSQQSEVCVQPEVKRGTQPGTTQTPVAPGFACWQMSPAAHTVGGMPMLPAHGPPSEETHWHASTAEAVGTASHVARNGHEPPHVPPIAAPHPGGTQAGPGPQHEVPVVASTQMQACSHVPLTH